ncbi:MAG: hypothetical protein ABSH48_05265 [Verrucomicrobiota bacterium]
MIEGGWGQTPLGKTILAACLITDFGTVLALGTLFADFNGWLAVFVGVTAVTLWFMPKWTQFIITKLGSPCERGALRQSDRGLDALQDAGAKDGDSRGRETSWTAAALRRFSTARPASKLTKFCRPAWLLHHISPVEYCRRASRR